MSLVYLLLGVQDMKVKIAMYINVEYVALDSNIPFFSGDRLAESTFDPEPVKLVFFMGRAIHKFKIPTK